jgi:hypothetical protein
MHPLVQSVSRALCYVVEMLLPFRLILVLPV